MRQLGHCLTDDFNIQRTARYAKSGATKYPSENNCLATKLFGFSIVFNFDITNKTRKQQISATMPPKNTQPMQ